MEITISEENTNIRLVPAEFYAILDYLSKKEKTQEPEEESWEVIRNLLRNNKENC